jgi:hypothetical protein
MTDGPLASYKLHVWMYEGASDEDLDQRTLNMQSTQKFVNLMLYMVDEYKGCGHSVMMILAYMGDIMAQIGQEDWGFNMVGTTQTNRTKAPAAAELKKMKTTSNSGAANFDYSEFPEVAAHVKLNIRVFDYTCRYSILHGRKIM